MTGPEFTKRNEGFSAKPYLCPSGKRTIGYGRCLSDNPFNAEEIAYLLRDRAVCRQSTEVAGALIHVSLFGGERNLRVEPLTREEGDWLFERDYAEAKRAMNAACRRRMEGFTLSSRFADIVVRKAALVDMAYQMGEGGLFGFERMWLAIGKGDWDEAARECLDSEYARKHPTRAGRVAQMLRTGEWPNA